MKTITISKENLIIPILIGNAAGYFNRLLAGLIN